MRIQAVSISSDVLEKLFRKGIEVQEVEDALKGSSKHVFRTRKGRYLAITQHKRYLAIVFEYENGDAEIVTAYPPSDWEIKLYKKKIKK